MCDSLIDSLLPQTQTLQDRLGSLQELTEFTENCQKQLDELFETLGWTQDFAKASAQELMEVCPLDPNHRVPSKSMERHKATCQLSKMGYSHEEQAEMYDMSVCYEKANITSFSMDKHTQKQVILQARASAPPIRTEGLYSQSEYSTDPPEVPQNHKRATCDLSVADRLALYNHVMSETNQQREQAESANNEDLYVDLVAKLKKGADQNGPKSHLEMMAEMRDYKRRRQSYRAKNVHITKKSYTEVIREVIDVHSGELSRQWKEDERQEEEELRESKHAPHRRRSASTESRHSHLSSRDGRAPPRKRHRSQERNKDGSREQNREQSQERSEREKERKKKRKRDSHSPDEKHHDRKKKKKKKKKEEK